MRIEDAPVEMVSIQALAARLDVPERFVRRLVEERRIPYFKVGKYVRFDPAEVERWLANARVGPAWRARAAAAR